MDQELRELFDLRWKERNRVLGEKFLRVKQEMNANEAPPQTDEM